MLQVYREASKAKPIISRPNSFFLSTIQSVHTRSFEGTHAILAFWCHIESVMKKGSINFPPKTYHIQYLVSRPNGRLSKLWKSTTRISTTKRCPRQRIGDDGSMKYTRQLLSHILHTQGANNEESFPLAKDDEHTLALV